MFANKALPDRNVIAHVQKDFTGSAVNKPVFLVHQVLLLTKLFLDIVCNVHVLHKMHYFFLGTF